MLGREDEIFINQGSGPRDNSATSATNAAGALLCSEPTWQLNGDEDGRPYEVRRPPRLIWGSVERGEEGAAYRRNDCYQYNDLFPHGAGLLPLRIVLIGFRMTLSSAMVPQ